MRISTRVLRFAVPALAAALMSFPCSAESADAGTVRRHDLSVTRSANGDPSIHLGGVVNAADYTQAFAPGIIFSIFGSNLAPSTEIATTVPLPTALSGVTVEIVSGANVETAPLFFVSAGQINAQLPFGPFSDPVLVRVRNASGVSNEEPISVSTAAPRLFTRTMDGLGEPILVHQDYSLVSAESPARAGEWVVLYLTGLGIVDPPVTAGTAGGTDTLSWALGFREVFVNGESANVYFAGLAPGFVGLYQINFQIPETAAAGMAELIVQLAGLPSQDAIRFGCSVAYAAAKSIAVGTGGGTVSGGGITVKIPAGGLSSATPVTVYNVTGGTPISTDEDDPVYAVGGIPEDYSATVEVTVDVPGEPPVAGAGALVMITESGAGGEKVLETTIQGSTATATLDLSGTGTVAQKASGAAPQSGERRAANVLDTANAGLQLWQYVRDLREVSSSSGHFAVHYNSEMFSEAQAIETATGLDEAEQQLLPLGFSWPSGTRYPIEVAMTSSTGGLFDTTIGGVKWNEATRQWTLRVNGNARVGLPEMMRRAMRVSLLAAAFGDQIDTTIRLDDLFQSNSWLWWHTAMAESLALRSLETDGAENPWLYSEAAAYADFLFQHPLQYPAADVAIGGLGYEPVKRHGFGAALFVKHLTSQRGNANWIPEVYASWSESKTPVEVLEDIGFDVAQEWLEFCRKMSLGEFNFVIGSFLNSAEAMTKSAVRNQFQLSSKESFPASYTWNATDLSAQVVRYNLDYAFENDSKLVVTLPQGGADTVARVFRDTTSSGSPAPEFLGEIRSGESLEITDPSNYNGSGLVVMLINSRAVKPYNGVTPVQVLIELATNEESEVISWLKQCKRISIWLSGLDPKCAYASGNDTSCGFVGMVMTNVDTSREQLVPIQWTGRTFSYSGTIYYPGSMNDTVEVSATGTVSEDGLTIESAQFYKKEINTTYSGEVIWEMQVSGIPYDGVPFASRSVYSYKVKNTSVAGATEILKYNEYDDGELYKTMSGYDFSGGAQIDLSFWKEQ